MAPKKKKTFEGGYKPHWKPYARTAKQRISSAGVVFFFPGRIRNDSDNAYQIRSNRDYIIMYSSAWNGAKSYPKLLERASHKSAPV